MRRRDDAGLEVMDARRAPSAALRVIVLSPIRSCSILRLICCADRADQGALTGLWPARRVFRRWSFYVE
jgi:hypothetical protein